MVNNGNSTLKNNTSWTRWGGHYPRMQYCFNIEKSFQVIVHISKQKEKTHDHLEKEKAFNKIQYSFVIIILSILGIEQNLFSLTKSTYEKPVAESSIVKTRCFPTKACQTR